MTTPAPDLGDLQRQLDAANKALNSCVVDETTARTRTTEARNQVNRLQSAFENAVKTMMQTAPRETDWAVKVRST